MDSFIKITEQNSNYNDIEKKSVNQILKEINFEDLTVAKSVEKELDSIELVIQKAIECIKNKFWN